MILETVRSSLKNLAIRIILFWILLSGFSLLLALSSNPIYVTPSGDYHIVKEGETIVSISNKYALSVDKIKLFNNMTSDRVFVGQKIFLYPHKSKKQDFVTQRKIPGNGYHLVKPKESIHRIAKMYGLSVFDILDFNDLNTYKLEPGMKISLLPGRKSGKTSLETNGSAKPKISEIEKETSVRSEVPDSAIDFILPLKGTVTSEFGLRDGRPHKGIDISAEKGDPILAVQKGKVVYSGSQRGYGNVIILEHRGYIMTVYAHNETNLVRVGDAVGKGQPIATVGQTGTASGPHLHFEYRVKGKAVDPRSVLPSL
ncbi:MAG: peptidoglycan DD-metalloendopeptidase family protein [Candidatus Cloacimonetes bacterium]|nr:peptidoglycan DD-metalloendopeptidase family protein [Candidatus Cloacimonadota bacterium]